jgi:immune inhibitor A
MWQKVEWDARRRRRVPTRAIRNAPVVVTAILWWILIPLTALATTPPRPGSDVRPPRALPALADKSASARPTGQQRVPVIPGGFANLPGAATTASLQAVFTGPGSVRDYFLAVSSGQLDVTGEVHGWRRAAQTLGHYLGVDHGLDGGAGQFVRDIVEAADLAGLDWGPYDNDGPDGVPNSGDDDGRVDAVVVLHAGAGGECGAANLWSHRHTLTAWGLGAYTTRTARAGGGWLTVTDYILVPEESCDGGIIEIGVICHEYGHILGLPDLYDTATGEAGIGGWGLMGTGSWGGDGQHPESPSWPGAWSRRDLGWCTEAVVAQDGPVTLPAVGADDQVLVLRDPTMPAGELFLVENRLRTGYDQSLPGEGLLIWHVDGPVLDAYRWLNAVNTDDRHGVALEQADGLDQLGLNHGDAGDPWPGSAGRNRFAAGTVPSSHTNDGQRTDVVVRAITTPRDPASIAVEIGITDLDTSPPAVSVLQPAGGEDWTLGDPATVVWSASDDRAVTAVDLRLSRDGGATFPVLLAESVANSGVWTGNLGLVPGTALVVQVRARDEAGNAAAATGGVFALRDRYAPGVILSAAPPAGAVLQPGDAVTVSWLAADNVGVVAVDLELSCDGGVTWSATEVRDRPGSGDAIWVVPDLPCGLARLRAVARDAAGNAGQAPSEVFAIAGTTTGVPQAHRLQLGPCIPNPFNPRAEIVFTLPAAGLVTLSVHDATGRRVRRLLHEARPAGRQSVVWDGRDDRGRGTASGVYWVRAQGPGGAALLKVTLLR